MPRPRPDGPGIGRIQTTPIETGRRWWFTDQMDAFTDYFAEPSTPRHRAMSELLTVCP